MSEHNHQCAVVSFFKAQYPKFADCIWSTPNERMMSKGKSKGVFFAYLKKLKRSGLKSGVSDLFIAVPNSQYHGMALEMKDAKKTYCSVTKSQREHLATMDRMGYYSTWSAGSDDAIKEIIFYMSMID